MDRVSTGLPRGPHVLGRVEVRSDLDDGVRRLCMQGSTVVGREDSDRLEPLLAAGAEHAQRDFTPVRDEYATHQAAKCMASQMTAAPAMFIKPVSAFGWR